MNSTKALASFGLLVLLASTQVACDGTAGRHPAAVDTAVTIEQAAIPARYAAPLPTSVAGLQAWLEGNPKVAPAPHVVEHILQGDPAWLARLGAAARAVPESERQAWTSKSRDLFEFQSVGPAFCAQARPILSGPPATGRAAISGPFAKSCAKDEDAPLVLRADTPYWAVLEYFDPWNAGGGVKRRRPFHPRLADAAREAILNGSEREARSAAFTLAEQCDPKADAALAAIQAKVRDRARADEVTIDRHEHPCGIDKAQPQARDERAPLAAVKARVAQLKALGFEKVESVSTADLTGDSAEEILLAAGHAYAFDVETGMFPNQHDSLMRSLAALVAPELSEAVFEERAPAMDDESGPYELLVYAGGKLYRTQAQNLDDWYDVDAVLRLMNAVMADRKAAARFTNLEATDQTLTIVGAPPAVIKQAAENGLLKLGDASEAERIGKEFETQVLRSLGAK